MAATATDWRAVAVVVASGVIVALQVGKGIITLPALRADFGLSLGAALCWPPRHAASRV